MKTSSNNNNIESNNRVSQVVIDLRPEVKHHEGYGREKVADVYFRTQVRAYSRQVYGDYSQEAHEAAEKATAAYYSEVVELLKGEGWTLLNDYAKWHTCPELTKGDQYLYVHPDSISGEVTPADIDALEAKFKALTACEYRGTDNYGDIILTRSEADERMLYRETYTEGIAATVKECTTTKRSNLYKDRGDALGCIRSRIAIQNKRTDLTGHGTGYYRERKAVAGFVQEEYDRLLEAGYIKEATGQNGRTLCRWINKKEEKELTKARREAEKAEKERKAAERQERYEARCKDLEAEALAQMPYKVGDIVTSRYGETGRVIEMHPEITGDIDSPHLVYEYTGKPLVNVVILDTNGKRHCAHWSVYTLEPAPEIKAIDVLQVGTMVRMPGVIGGLRVEEIDRKGDRVICVDGCKERHTYKGLDYFTTTAEEICIPEWLRICQYFEMDESFGHTRVLCTDIEPCCDALWPVLIRWEDGEEKGGIYLTSALDALNRKAYYYSEYQKLGHQETRPQEWLKKTTNEKRATYYRACVELERMAGDGLPLVIRADGADTEANPWNALEKRVKTARVFHLGDRVKMHYPYQCNEVTGVINRIRFDEGSLSLGGWCTHYDIRFDEEYQRPNNFGGKDTGVGNISPERIELVERAEFCPEPASEWLQPGEKVAHYLDYGDGTGDWLIGNVTGYELCDDGTVIVIYGEYRTPLKGMVKYQPEMDEKAA